MRNLVVYFPPFPEQRRIVAKLEELFTRLDAGVTALKAVQAQLKRYRASVLKAAVEGRLVPTEADLARAEGRDYEPADRLLARILAERRAKAGAKYKEPVAPNTANLPELPEGWVWATVEQLASKDDYALAIGPFGSNLKVSDYANEGVPLIFVRNITTSSFSDYGSKYVSQTKANELRAHWVSAGDILITKMGDPPGDACIYPENNPIGVITADCIKFRPMNLTNVRYILTAINSQVVQRQLLNITKGVAQLKVSLGRFRGVAIPVPPLAEQHHIVTEVERRLSVVDELEADITTNLKRADRLRQSILQRAFTGKLVPQDPNDEPAEALLRRTQIKYRRCDGSADVVHLNSKQRSKGDNANA